MLSVSNMTAVPSRFCQHSFIYQATQPTPAPPLADMTALHLPLPDSLVLTKPGYIVDATTTVLETTGVPYDILRLDASTAAKLEAASMWRDAQDGSGTYSGIFMQVGERTARLGF